MTVNTNSMISISEANQNFSKVTRLVDSNGSAVIMKNNVPRYVMIDYSKYENDSYLPDEEVLAMARKILDRDRKMFERLAE